MKYNSKTKLGKFRLKISIDSTVFGHRYLARCTFYTVGVNVSNLWCFRSYLWFCIYSRFIYEKLTIRLNLEIWEPWKCPYMWNNCNKLREMVLLIDRVNIIILLAVIFISWCLVWGALQIIPLLTFFCFINSYCYTEVWMC